MHRGALHTSCPDPGTGNEDATDAAVMVLEEPRVMTKMVAKAQRLAHFLVAQRQNTGELHQKLEHTRIPISTRSPRGSIPQQLS